MDQLNTQTSKGLSVKIISAIVVVVALLIVVVVCVAVFKVARIDNFESCAAKYPVMESQPERCRTPDGRVFTRQIP